MKATNKTITSTKLPHGVGLKDYLEDNFDNLKARGILTLKIPARKAIIDHIDSCLEIFGKSTSPKTTKKGFIENVMIDEQIYTYPGTVKMLRTYTSYLKQEA